MTATHARRGAFTRLAARLRPAPADDFDEATRTAFAIVSREAEDTRQDLEAMFSAPAPHAEIPGAPVHMVADGYGIMPCCEQHETAVPQTRYVTANPRLVTCRTSAHDTMPDRRAPMDRPYTPSPLDCPYIPGPFILGDDLRDLPGLRGTIRARAWFFHHGCQCERWSATGSAGWLAGQYAEVTAKPALSWWTLRVPAEPVQSDDTLTWGRAVA